MNNVANSQIDIAELLSFAKTSSVKVILRALISLGFVIALLAAYYALAPRTESYRQEMLVSLPENNETLVYKNGQPFSTSDILAAPILRELWVSYGFSERGVKFEDFTSAFSAYNWNRERAAIDAELASKLAKRNISVTDIAKAQKEYESQLAALDKHTFMVEFSSKALSTDRDVISKMLVDLPKLWAARSKRVYAPVIPKLADAGSVQTALARSAKIPSSEFDTVDYLMQYCGHLRETCQFVREQLNGVNLEHGGVTIGALDAQVDLAMCEITQCNMALLSSCRGDADSATAMRVRRAVLAREMMVLERQIAVVKAAISQFASTTQVSGCKGSDGGIILQTDGNFIDQYTALVRENLHSNDIKEYLEKQLDLEKQLAELKGRDLAYELFEQSLTNRSSAAAAPVALALDEVVKSVVNTGKSVEQFRDYVLENSLQPGDFYKIQTPVYYARSFRFSLPRVALGLLAIWALCNLLGVALLWYKRT